MRRRALPRLAQHAALHGCQHGWGYIRAGQHITEGVVNAAECSRLGLLGDGYANPCGLEKARTEVDTWQDPGDCSPALRAASASVELWPRNDTQSGN